MNSKAKLYQTLCIVISAAATSAGANETATPAQLENRRLFMNVVIASGCDRKFGETSLLKAALEALEHAARTAAPEDALELRERTEEFLAKKPDASEAFSMLASRPVCARLKEEVSRDLDL